MGPHEQLPPYSPRVGNVASAKPIVLPSSESTGSVTPPHSTIAPSEPDTHTEPTTQRKRPREEVDESQPAPKRARMIIDLDREPLVDVAVPPSPGGSVSSGDDIGSDNDAVNSGPVDDDDAMDLVAEADIANGEDGILGSSQSPLAPTISDERPTIGANTTIITSAISSTDSAPSAHVDESGDDSIGGATTTTGTLEAVISPCAPSDSLTARYPAIAAQWSPRNHPLTAAATMSSSSAVVWWECPAVTCGCKHEWEISVISRTRQYNKSITESMAAGQSTIQSPITDCPFCRGVAVCQHNNLAVKYPNLVEYWDPALNGGMELSDTGYSALSYTWRCDPASRRHDCQHPHVWRARVRSHMRCPYCWEAGRKVCPCRSLGHLYPELAARYRGKADVTQVDAPTRRVPSQYPSDIISVHSRHFLAWWECERGHWTKNAVATTVTRYVNSGMFYCSDCLSGKGRRVIRTVDDVNGAAVDHTPVVASVVDLDAMAMPPPPPRPKQHALTVDTPDTPVTPPQSTKSPYKLTVSEAVPQLLKQWSPRNGDLSPSDIMPSSARKIWWICKDAPCGCTHHWRASVSSRCKLEARRWHVTKPDCPKCEGRHSEGCSHTSIVTTHPHMARMWYYELNKGISTGPTRIMAKATRVVWWKCMSYKKGCMCDHSWKESVAVQVGYPIDQACPYCSGRLTCPCKTMQTIQIQPDS